MPPCLCSRPPLLAAVACAPEEDADDTASEPTPTAADQCDKENLPLLNDGTLTIATDSPAFPPWFVDDDPTNGEGYESAVAYAVADQLGFAADEVTWVTVPFNNSYKPGAKNFDFDINQISISPERAEAVDFSDELLRRRPGRRRAEGLRRRGRGQHRRPARASDSARRPAPPR